MKKNFTWLLLLAGLSSSVPLMAQNFAISLDGATNSVTTPAQIVPTAADFTVEFWAYIPSLDALPHEFVSQGSLGSGALYIGYDATGNIRVGDNWTSTGAQVPLGSWFHLAVTYFAATTTANLYINDVIEATNAAFPALTAGGSNFAIGEQTDGSQLLLGEMDELNVWSTARTQASIKSSMLRGLNPADPTFSNVVAYYKMNEGSGSTLTNISNTPGLNGTINGTVSGSTWASSPIQYALNALSFDGVEAQVVVPPNALWDGLSQATVEVNVNPGNLPAFANMLGVRGAAGTKFNFDINNTATGLYNGGAFFAVGAPGPSFAFTPGTWYHLSFVVDGAQDTTGVFVDGEYAGQIPLSFGATNGLPLIMGLSQNMGSDAEQFLGSLDDPRIWNIMLTQAQIKANMGNEMIGTEPGLVAEYTFDQGIAGGNNSFLNTAFDNTPNNNHGAMANFTLSGGTTANFVTGATIIPLPVNFTTFTAVAQGKEAVLQWQTAQEQNSRDYTIERSPDGSPNSFTPIGTVPAAGNSSTKLNYNFRDVSPLIGMNYYQLKETDLDNHFMFSPLRSLEFAFSGSSLYWHQNGANAVEVDLNQGNSDSYIVTDLLGRTIQQGQMSFGKMYLTHVPTGIYVIKVFSPSGVQYSTKVLVQ